MSERRDGLIAVLIPAAGASRRLGFPKQLAQVDGESLLRRSVRTALEANIGPVVTILGHQADELSAEVEGLACEVLKIADWSEGMSASIRAGVARFRRDGRISAVLIVLVDQWALKAADLLRLAEAWRCSGVSLAAAEYDNRTVGVPAIFGDSHFDALLSLTGDAGARHLLRAAGTELIRVPMSNAAADFDELPRAQQPDAPPLRRRSEEQS